MPWCDGPKVQFSFDGESDGRTCKHGNLRPHEYEAPALAKLGRSITSGMMSSAEDRYSTPPELYAALDDVFHFGFDAAADSENAKHERYLTVEDDALECDRRLSLPWITKIVRKYHPEVVEGCKRMNQPVDELGLVRNSCFLNPPYGKWLLPFMHTASQQSAFYHTTIAMLVAGRLETEWFAIGNKCAHYRLELSERVVFTEPGCPQGYVFDRNGKLDGRPIIYDYPATPPPSLKFEGPDGKVYEHGIPQVINFSPGTYPDTRISYPRIKRSQPAFPSVVLIFGHDSTKLQLYKLHALGFMIDLNAQRKINEGRAKNGHERKR